MIDAYQVVAVDDRRRIVGPFGYWNGDDWTTSDNAKVYHRRKELRKAIREAMAAGLPKKATGVSEVSVVVA